MFNPFKRDTTFQYCYRCTYWSEETLNRLKYRKSFRFLRWKYWRFLLDKYNFLRKGRCTIVLIDGDHNHLITRGNNTCFYDTVKEDIIDPKSFVGNLPDNPEDMFGKIKEIERNHVQKQPRPTSKRR